MIETNGITQYFPDGGTFVVPERVTKVWMRYQLPLDYNPCKNPVPVECEYVAQEVTPGQVLTMNPRQEVSWLAP
jgi:hypothetical protein